MHVLANQISHLDLRVDSLRRIGDDEQGMDNTFSEVFTAQVKIEHT